MTFKNVVTDDDDAELGLETDEMDVGAVAADGVVIDASPDGDNGLKDRTAAAMRSSLVVVDVAAAVGTTNVGVIVDIAPLSTTFTGRCSTLIGFDLNFISSKKPWSTPKRFFFAKKIILFDCLFFAKNALFQQKWFLLPEELNVVIAVTSPVFRRSEVLKN